MTVRPPAPPAEPQDRQAAAPAPAEPALRAAGLLRRLAVPAFALAAIAAGWWALGFAGAAAEQAIGDPGALARFGLPAALFVFNAATALTIGALALALFALPRTPRSRRRKGRGAERAAAGGPPPAAPALDPAWSAALAIAQAASVVWTLAAAAVLVFTYVDAAGAQAYAGDFSAQLGQYIATVDAGRLWMLILLLAVVTSMVVFASRSWTGIAWAFACAVVSLVPQALMGHASEASGHTQAVNSLLLHLGAVTLWMGGLLALALLAPRLTGRADLADIVRRYSAIALVGALVIVYSGLVNAGLRVHGLGDWGSRYGVLVLTKLLLTVLLMALGYWHRRFVIGRLAAAAGARAEFWRLVLAEVVLFGAVMAMGVALSRSQPPVSQEPPSAPTPAEILTGEPLPPAPSGANYFLQWSVDPLWVVVAVGAVALYVAGAVRLHRRGDRWPVLRTLSWILGMAGLFYVTCGGPVVYGQVLFSGHMIQHMLIVMAVPLPMAFAAPITLLMRAVHPRTDGSRGLREWVLVLVHSHWLRFFANPIVAAINFAGSLIVFYYSGIMEYALTTHIGHELMLLHFLAAGYMFAQSIVGIDPGAKRFPYPVRLLVLLVTMTFHAFFGISIMSSTVLIEGDWYGNMGQPWSSALDDQQLGGGIAWGIGEFPTLILAIGAAVQWSRSSDREAKRKDRAEARSGDAELRAYNEMLARLGKRR
ncbi:cytochrome c oxidase assembly protein [Brevibacterium sp. BRM-1]|uniref:cytochrome c oxidase assembly protein n=1 Tax=Brevibacterium sp. BRM-1 TaxID=2999062 RepID=UPI00227ED86C|nr:cytochrome c oxidase assembly protein [Brevibacterium sp. BRM-1]WAL39436.1 cytochrome c oxidase assembly protein [Brevibacterium sp. BRM-1]